MKKHFEVLILLFISFISIPSFAQQWIGSASPSVPIYRSGRVGIGMNSAPTQQLELRSGNMLTAYASGATAGNLFFGGITSSSQPGMRLFYNNSGVLGGFIDVRASNPGDGLLFRVDVNNGGTERMRITADGKVGIGTTTPGFTLDVNGSGKYATTLQVQGPFPFFSSKFSAYSPDAHAAIGAFAPNSLFAAYIEGLPTGVFGVAGVHTTGGAFPAESKGVWGYGGPIALNRAVGVHGDGNGSKYAIGVWGEGFSGSIMNYGVWGDIYGNGYAGYFSGDVYTTGLYLPSDNRLKTNLQAFTGALDQLMKINVYQFNFNVEKYPTLRLPGQKQYGLLADEVEKVFPEFTKKAVQPERLDSTGKVLTEAVEFKSVNYEALIPVLIQAVKEQQQEIEALKQDLAELKPGKRKKNK